MAGCTGDVFYGGEAGARGLFKQRSALARERCEILIDTALAPPAEPAAAADLAIGKPQVTDFDRRTAHNRRRGAPFDTILA